MPFFTVRLDDETKKSMESLSDVDWNDVIRKGIRDHLEARRRQNRVEALVMMERISARVSVLKGHDGAKTIRTWRDRRHGTDRA